MFLFSNSVLKKKIYFHEKHLPPCMKCAICITLPSIHSSNLSDSYLNNRAAFLCYNLESTVCAGYVTGAVLSMTRCFSAAQQGFRPMEKGAAEKVEAIKQNQGVYACTAEHIHTPSQ